MEDKKIWDFLLYKLNNPYGVAALMGNLYVESKLNPKDLQGSYARKLGMTDDEYTQAVDDGTYSSDKFIHDSAGYGLAQWTHWSRKENLYKYASKCKASIGDLNMQLNFLWDELQKYKTVVTALMNANNIREASDIVVKHYEKPTHQEEKYLASRAKYGQGFYDKFINDDSKFVIATSNVNIRVGNGKEYEKVSLLPKGESLLWIATAENGWHAVKYDNHVYWVSGEFSYVSP